MFSGLNILDNNDLSSVQGYLDTEELFESSVELLSCNQDISELLDLDILAGNLENLHTNISKHGISMQVLEFVNDDGVLNKIVPAFESITSDVALEEETTNQVKQSLMARIAQATAAFFKKIWEVVTKWGTALGKFCTSMYNKALDAAKWMGEKIKNGYVATKNFITAHPVISTIAALTAVSVSVAVIYKLWNKELPQDQESEDKYIKESEAELKKVESQPTFLNKVQKGAADALGYTKDKFNQLIQKIKDLFGPNGSLSKLVAFFKNKLSSLWTKVKAMPAAAQSHARKAIAWITNKTKSFVHGEVVDTADQTSQTLNTFKKENEEDTEEVSVIFAARIQSREINNNESMEKQAPELFDRSEMRWSGTSLLWHTKLLIMGLKSTGQEIPEEDGIPDKKIIVVYSSHLPKNKIPNNRSSIKRTIIQLVEENKIEFKNFIKTKVGVNITSFGFEEF